MYNKYPVLNLQIFSEFKNFVCVRAYVRVCECPHVEPTVRVRQIINRKLRQAITDTQIIR